MLIRRLGWGYVLLMALWLLLRLVFFDRLWWLALINSLAFYLLLPLTVFVGHLAPNNMLGYPLSQFTALTAERYAVREAESRYLPQEFQSLGEPALLMCDCNMTDTSETYTILSNALHDSFQEAGWGLGHTLYVGSLPVRLQRVDYIWHTGDLVATDARVGPDGGSDHRPIVATLQFVR